MNIEPYIRFAIGIISSLFLNVILRMILVGILDFANLSAITYILLFWVGYAFNTIISCWFGFKILKLMSSSAPQKNLPQNVQKSETPFKPENEYSIFDGFKITKKDVKPQILATMILLCCVYIPLDFISYLVPGILDFQAKALLVSDINQYLLWDLPIMLMVSSFVHFFVALREEFFYRNFIISTASNQINKETGFIYSAFLFGLAHFSYIFVPVEENLSIFYPFWWGLNALFIGLISAYYYHKTHHLWPVIIAHWLNNVISAYVTKNYIEGNDFWQYSFLNIYLPVILCGIILGIFNRKTISHSIKDLFHLIKTYLKPATDKTETNLENYKEKKGKQNRNSDLTLKKPEENESSKKIIVDIVLILIIWVIATIFF
jgi:membrane protease YdiL (CAAX protease family)